MHCSLDGDLKKWGAFRILLLCLVVGWGQWAFVDDEDDSEGPVMGYEDLNCEGDGVRFESLVVMLQSNDPVYWSWHIEGSKRKCKNVEMEEMVVTGTRLPTVSFSSASFSGSATSSFTRHVLHSLTRWSDEAWVNAMNDAQACWRRKARDADVKFLDQEFTVNVNWELWGQGETIYDPSDMSFQSIEINPDVIGAEASRFKHYFYTDLVYTLIHESIHAERLVEGTYYTHPEHGYFDQVYDEREVQKLAYQRYWDIYGKQPPFKYMSDREFNQSVRKYNRLKEEFMDLVNENDLSNEERIEEKKKEIKAEAAKLNRGVKNDDYYWRDDKIDTC